MKPYFYLLSTLLVCLSINVNSQEIHVGIEPIPPILTEDGKGYAVDMLRSIEKESNLQFHFHVMSYARAKKALKSENLDMLGLTPQGNETAEFYEYAEDLSWSITSKVDLYSYNKAFLNTDSLSKNSIGTLKGNADFFSELLNIPRDKFVEISNLSLLIQMLERNKLSVITFERAATMKTFKKYDIDKVYYKNVADIPASFAVKNNETGKALKAKIDKYLSHTTSNRYFNDHFYYQNLPDTGSSLNFDKP